MCLGYRDAGPVAKDSGCDLQIVAGGCVLTGVLESGGLHLWFGGGGIWMFGGMV